MSGPTNYQRTAAWLKACGKAPGDKVGVQVGCVLEEVRELLEHVMTNDMNTRHVIVKALESLELAGTVLKSGQQDVYFDQDRRASVLDALCDIEVTINGVAYLLGFNKDGADQQVLAANDRKLVNGKPVLLPGGKIGKPEDWFPPNLQPFV